MQTDRAVVDEYLTKWDQFAGGQNSLVPYLRENKSTFESALTRLLQSGDRCAPSRLVFYPVVQVGGAIPAESELGMAARAIIGKDFPIADAGDGTKVLFGADLYWWWKRHETEFEHFSVFDDWLRRDFARTTVLPMYEQLKRTKG